jgi:hypothetical protein
VLSFALVTYTYTAGRFLGPVMALALLLVMPWRRALVAWIAYAVLLIPALLNFRALTARLSEVGWSFDYLSAFSPRFLFLTGDANPRHHVAFGGMLLVTVAIMALVGIGVAIRTRDAWSRYLLAMLVLAPIPGALAPEAPHALRLIALGVVIVVLAGFGMQSVRLGLKSGGVASALQIALLIALVAEGLAFRTQYNNLGPERVDDFDAGYPHVFARVRPPVCVEESPYYIHAYWYGTLRGIPRAQLPRFNEGTEPRGRVCVGSAPVCPTCRVLADVRGFVAYRRD